MKKYPAGLARTGRKLWRQTVDAFDLDAHEETILLNACKTADLIDRLQAVADDSEISGRAELDRQVFGELRRQRALLAQLIKQLREDEDA